MYSVMNIVKRQSDGLGGSYSAVRLDHFVAEDCSQAKLVLGEIGNSSRRVVDS